MFLQVVHKNAGCDLVAFNRSAKYQLEKQELTCSHLILAAFRDKQRPSLHPPLKTQGRRKFSLWRRTHFQWNLQQILILNFYFPLIHICSGCETALSISGKVCAFTHINHTDTDTYLLGLQKKVTHLMMTMDKRKRGKKSLILIPPASVHDKETLKGVIQTQSWKRSCVSESGLLWWAVKVM